MTGVQTCALPISVHSQDEALMCRVFPSSLGPMLMRWFNGPEKVLRWLEIVQEEEEEGLREEAKQLCLL